MSTESSLTLPSLKDQEILAAIKNRDMARLANAMQKLIAQETRKNMVQEIFDIFAEMNQVNAGQAAQDSMEQSRQNEIPKLGEEEELFRYLNGNSIFIQESQSVTEITSLRNDEFFTLISEILEKEDSGEIIKLLLSKKCCGHYKKAFSGKSDSEINLARKILFNGKFPFLQDKLPDWKTTLLKFFSINVLRQVLQKIPSNKSNGNLKIFNTQGRELLTLLINEIENENEHALEKSNISLNLDSNVVTTSSNQTSTSTATEIQSPQIQSTTKDVTPPRKQPNLHDQNLSRVITAIRDLLTTRNFTTKKLAELLSENSSAFNHDRTFINFLAEDSKVKFVNSQNKSILIEPFSNEKLLSLLFDIWKTKAAATVMSSILCNENLFIKCVNVVNQAKPEDRHKMIKHFLITNVNKKTINRLADWRDGFLSRIDINVLIQSLENLENNPAQEKNTLLYNSMVSNLKGIIEFCKALNPQRQTSSGSKRSADKAQLDSTPSNDDEEEISLIRKNTKQKKTNAQNHNHSNQTNAGSSSPQPVAPKVVINLVDVDDLVIATPANTTTVTTTTTATATNSMTAQFNNVAPFSFGKRNNFYHPLPPYSATISGTNSNNSQVQTTNENSLPVQPQRTPNPPRQEYQQNPYSREYSTPNPRQKK